MKAGRKKRWPKLLGTRRLNTNVNVTQTESQQAFLLFWEKADYEIYMEKQTPKMFKMILKKNKTGGLLPDFRT